MIGYDDEQKKECLGLGYDVEQKKSAWAYAMMMNKYNAISFYSVI